MTCWNAVHGPPMPRRALDESLVMADDGGNLMELTIALAHAGGTTGRVGSACYERHVGGEYRAPTGVSAAAGSAGSTEDLRSVAVWVKALPGGPLRIPVAKPGLDGTATAPSRSPSPPAMPAWRSSTRAFA